MNMLLKYNRIITFILSFLIILVLIFSPHLSQLAKENGKVLPPEDTTSQQYRTLLKQVGADYNSMVIVIKSSKALTREDRQLINDYVNEIESVDHVNKVISPTTNQEIYNKLVAKDKKTLMIPVQYASDDSQKIASDIKNVKQNIGKVYITNNELMMDDINTSTDEGLKTTEIVTVALIFIILVIVFKSIVTPLVPLLIVGISYLFSSSLIALLVEHFNFPVSIYIQPFLVALLFGIGTDYCILLLSRFKEELTQTNNRYTAVYRTFEQEGKTILACGLTIIAGFSALFFVQFDLFKSAVGIGVGVIALMAVIYTLLPFLMLSLGNFLFWPSKKTSNHGDNKLWGRLGQLTINHSFLTIILVLIVCIPLIYFIPTNITYDNTNEISDDYDSVKALNIIKSEFDLGEAFPINVVIENDESLIQTESISEIENLAQSISKIEGVKSVNTLTRPTGQPIKEFQADYQLKVLSNKLNQSKEGLKEANSGINKMDAQISPYTNEQNVSQVMQQSAANPSASVQSVTQQAGELSKGFKQIEQGNDQMISGQNQMQERLNKMSNDNQINTSGMYLDQEMIKNDKFKDSIQQYSNNQGKVIMINIELEENPYSKKSFKTLEQVKQTINTQKNNTSFEDSRIEYGGITSQNADLDTTINHDMNKAVLLMSLFIFVVLAIFTKSFIMPIYMILSILLTYYVSMAVANIIYIDMLNTNGILLVAPFFSLVILMALGIDYAIFLVSRFNMEAESHSIADALIISMKKMGTIILTACIIIMGTFAALYTSGSDTLMQIATILIIGLVIYNVLMLPLLIPAIINTLGKGNWWPFIKKTEPAEIK